MEAWRKEIAAAGMETVEITPALNVAAAIRERRARGMRLFIAAGGDGTVHHVVQALVNTDSALGVLPIGTYNHFARDLGLPLDWREALEVALRGRERQIDCARVNERFFVNNVSLGLYPELVARREARGRDYPRWKARMYALYATARRYRHITVALESDVVQELISTHVLMVSNNSYDLEQIGVAAPRSALTDGKLSVYSLPHVTRWHLAKFVARYLAGRLHDVPGFRSFQTTRLRVQSSRRHLDAGIDGEVFRLATPFVITILPRSLFVRVPRATT